MSKQWVLSFKNYISDILKTVNIFHKIFNTEYNDATHGSNFYEINEVITSKNNDLNDKITEISNLRNSTIKIPIRTITRFSNKQIEVNLNDTLDSIGGFLSNELLLQRYDCDLNKDITIIDATNIFDESCNILFNSKNINIISFNSVTKVPRMDINKNFNTEISEDSYSTMVIGDIRSVIEVTVSNENEDEWKNEVISQYTLDSEEGFIKAPKDKIPETHYNKSSINIKNKEVTILYHSGD